MYLILEFYNLDAHPFLGKNGLPMQFDTVEEAVMFAIENCAFDYQIVELRGGNA